MVFNSFTLSVDFDWRESVKGSNRGHAIKLDIDQFTLNLSYQFLDRLDSKSTKEEDTSSTL